MRYLHTMLRVRNLDAALKFYSDALGLKEVRRVDNDKAKFTLVFLCAADDESLLKQSKGRGAPLVELRERVVAAPELSERQLRRIIYG